LATASGTEVRIVDGQERDVLLRVARGESLGTRFLARADPVESRKRWILSSLTAGGKISVDSGAARALLRQGASLLPAGITSVAGVFQRGDSVDIIASTGTTIACGIANYDVTDVVQMAGKRSSEIEQILGYSYGDYVVHRDDLVCVGTEESLNYA
jgi:glutamate 5-kinase